MADTKYLVDEEHNGIRYVVYENGGVHQWEAFNPNEAQGSIKGGEMKSIEGCRHSAKNFIENWIIMNKKIAHSSLKVVTANSQVFQALYIDTDAKEDKDKIVLIEEMVDSLSEAQGILHSMLKEPYYGMVVAGGNISIAKFRAKMYDVDHEENLGKEDMAEILTQIAKLAYSLKCEVVHFKGPVKYDKIPEQMRNVSVALDLKKIFDPKAIKEGGKEFWRNLIGFDKEIEKQYQALDLKEHKKLVDYLAKNEKSIENLKKALKDHGTKSPNLDNMLGDLKLNDFDEYLGPTYSNLKYYKIDLVEFKRVMNIADEGDLPPPVPPVEVDETNMSEEEKKGEFPYDKNKITNDDSNDPRLVLRSLLSNLPNANKKLMGKDNIVDIGINKDSLMLAIKKPDDYNVKWWPRAPIKGTVKLLESYDWLKNPKDDNNKAK